jgi:quercetin dioxygenase-like cupin family protein
MKVFDLGSPAVAAGAKAVDVLLEAGAAKVRRVGLSAGAEIPPCRMEEDVVFVVVSGRVTFREGAEAETVSAPGAVFIPGGAEERSMHAEDPSLVCAVLCRGAKDT